MLTEYTESLKNDRRFEKRIKESKGDRNVRFAAFCLCNQEIYFYQLLNLRTKFINRWRFLPAKNVKQSFQITRCLNQQHGLVCEQNSQRPVKTFQNECSDKQLTCIVPFYLQFVDCDDSLRLSCTLKEKTNHTMSSQANRKNQFMPIHIFF